MSNKSDYLIIGSGIMGLSLAKSLRKKFPDASIAILDKEKEEAYHASGRNSGVLHAGFYYTANSLKAQFTVKGNHALTQYCESRNILINKCGKLVVCQDNEELNTLRELEKRGKANGSNVNIITEKEAREIEPNVKTYQFALHSPDTASVDPKAVCRSIKDELLETGVNFVFSTKYLERRENAILTNQGDYEGRVVINCAGLYADTIAQDFGFGKQFTLIPFKGLYLKYTKNKDDIKTNIYPVPNLKNPFLGVHFTKTVHGDIKIGPTAIPAFWRENYKGLSHFNFKELFHISFYETRLFLGNHNHFRNLALEEWKKYRKDYMVRLSLKLANNLDPKGFTEYTAPGIRAQLIERNNLKFVQDFVVEGDSKSLHILNAVSPAFTCAFPFSEYVIKTYLQNV